MRKHILSYILFSVASICGFFALPTGADTCTCSCCDGLGDSIVSNILNSSCSSNCVRMTPSECVAMTNSILSSLSALDQNARTIESYSINAYRELMHLQEDMQEIRTLTEQAISSLATSNNNISVYLNNIYGTLNTMSNVYSSVENPVSAMTYSNITSGAAITISGPQRVSTYIQRIRRYLDNASLALTAFEERVHSDSSDVRSILGNDLLSYLDAVDEEIYGALQYVGPIPNEAETIMSEMSSLRSVVESVSCDSCGSGGGSGGGGGGTTDFAPILAAISSLQNRLDYWFQRLWDLIHKYYQDYNAASSSIPSGSIDYDTYSASQNWFERVEMLLYSISSINDSDTEEVPEKPDGAEELENFETSSEQAYATTSNDVAYTFSESFNILKKSIEDFHGSFDNFKVRFTNFDGSTILSNRSSNDGDTMPTWSFTVPNGVSSTLQSVRHLLSIIWYLIIAFLYYYALRFLVTCTIKYVLWYLQFSSASFGGGS